MVAERPKYFSDMQDAPDFLKSLEQTRRLSTREGWCRAHIEAIQVAIDQYAEAAFGNREFFLNKPHTVSPPDGGLFVSCVSGEVYQTGNAGLH